MALRTKTFKSGNSVALRLPKVLGVKEGTEMILREERGRYIVEPAAAEGAAPEKKIDLTGIWGSGAGLKEIDPEAEENDDIPRDWQLLGLKPH